MLEERLEACKSEYDLLVESDTIMRMVSSIEKLVNTINTLDLRQAITSEQIGEIVEAISVVLVLHLKDKEQLATINNAIKEKISGIL
jgi:hypothetical protein